MPNYPKPRATIVITQRDRVSAMPEALASLFNDTPEAFDLIYVTGPLPRRARTWLDDQARKRGFRSIEVDRPLTPAEARNIGLKHANTDFVVFAENDVIFKKGWLSALIACADETNADVVAPLICEGRAIHTIIHHVGEVETNAAMFDAVEAGERDFDEAFMLQGRTVKEAADFLVRRRTLSVEMHCFMVRRALFERIGPFDPDIVSKEYLDFSWAVRKAGGSIWVDPSAVVTFLVPSSEDPVRLSDLPYFLLRWSRAWQKRSHDALKLKWGLKEDGFIAQRRALADWRIIDHVVKPVLREVPLLGGRWGFVERMTRFVAAPLMAASSLAVWSYDRARRSEGLRAAVYESR